MNLGRELGRIINSQQDRILSLAHENAKLKKRALEPKKRQMVGQYGKHDIHGAAAKNAA